MKVCRCDIIGYQTWGCQKRENVAPKNGEFLTLNRLGFLLARLLNPKLLE
jgi:hypothetical protein